MSSIMTRVTDALRASGHTAEADELTQHVSVLKGNVDDILKLVQEQGKTIRLFINAVQSRCQHPVWHLADESQFAIACYTCGHTVCDEKVYKLYDIRSSLHRTGGRRFTLPLPIKRELGSKLIVEEIKGG